MRLLLLIALFLSVHNFLDAQIPREIQGQMKELGNELNKQISELEKNIIDAKKSGEDPEVIKSMEKELAMLKKQKALMGDVSKNLGRMGDKVIKQAVENDSIEQLRIIRVPALDKKRIAMIPQVVLTDPQLTVFISNVHAEVERIIPKEEKEEAMKLFALAKSLKKTSNEINNIATNLWASGQPEQAIYVLGKQCAADPGNTNNLNNYAAFLTMAGAEHAAVPILLNLQGKHSGNTTVMNNLGQAWYALGDMAKAKQYLRLAIAGYEYHSQANQTLCWILKSEGKDKEAIAALKKSIQDVYTSEKDHLLVKLGDSLKFRDFRFPYPGKSGTVDQLSIQEFISAIPAYPFEGGVTAEISYDEWHDFRQKVNAAIETVREKMKTLGPIVEAQWWRKVADPKLLEPYNNHVHITAIRKKKALIDWFADRMIAINKEYKKAGDSVKAWREEYDRNIQDLEDCGARKNVATTFLSKANGLYQAINDKHLGVIKAYGNTMARLALYFATDHSEYLAVIEDIKSTVLFALLNLPCVFEAGCVPSKPPQGLTKGPLPDFDSLTCKYKDKIYIPPFTTITTECNIMSTEVDVGSETLFEGFELKIKLGMVENLNSGKITKGSMELGVEGGVSGSVGPIEAALKGGIGAGIEVTRDGVKEVYVKTSVTAEWAGHVDEDDTRFVSEPTIDSKGTPLASGDLKISWNAGPQGEWGFENYNTSVTGSSSVNEFKKLILKVVK